MELCNRFERRISENQLLKDSFSKQAKPLQKTLSLNHLDNIEIEPCCGCPCSSRLDAILDIKFKTCFHLRNNLDFIVKEHSLETSEAL